MSRTGAFFVALLGIVGLLRTRLFRTAVAVLGAHATPASAGEPPGLARVSPGELRVTEGAIAPLPDGRMTIVSPKVRAVVGDPSTRSVQMKFRYLGPTSEMSPLSSGEARRQLGLKLLAQDGCNVVYVMWRIEPKSVLAVSVKSNPGQWLSSQCGANGYRNLPAHVTLPRLEPGANHTLRADLNGEDLIVRVDGAPVWRGSIGAEAVAVGGPVGLRTDNVRIEFELDAGTGAGGPRAGGRP